MPAVAEPPPAAVQTRGEPRTAFFPQRPASLDAAGLRRADAEDLALKVLLNRGAASAAEVAGVVRLPRRVVAEFLRELKRDGLVTYRSNAGPDDYFHELTDRGADQAGRAHERSRYHGCAPVSLEDYVASVDAQTLRRQRVTRAGLKAALADVYVNAETFARIGAALGSVGAMFLYGDPGNGKTMIAERLTRAYGEAIWIPRAVRVAGEVVRLFDAAVHEEVVPDAASSPRDEYGQVRGPDERWVRVRRPTVIVGGELTLEHLEVSYNRVSGVAEAPVQMKANGGTLVVDDFGRQRISPDALLNRWIVPLERGYDFLNTPGGRKVRVPFDLLTVFATNLEPQDLVDEAFLRRIPFKIKAADPMPEEFKALALTLAPRLGLEVEPAAVETLLTEHFLSADRPLRFCHPRDLLLQIKRRADFEGVPPVATADAFAAAVANYFGDL